jgi:hypothetical protein
MIGLQPVHLHRLPSNPWAMDTAAGWSLLLLLLLLCAPVLLLSAAAANATTMPGEQNPH